MKHRNPFLVFFFPFITFGIYSWYWYVSTKNEMNKMGEHIPTAWIWLIPFFGGIWWIWKYSEGVGHVTKDKLGGIFAFLLIFFLGMIGHAIIQDFFNKIGAAPAGVSMTPGQSSSPAAPQSATAPVTSVAPDVQVAPEPAIASPEVPTAPVPPAPQNPPAVK